MSTSHLPQPPRSTLPAGWERAYDQVHEVYYYFNRSLGTSQWHAPAGDDAATSLSHSPTPAAAAVAEQPHYPDSNGRAATHQEGGPVQPVQLVPEAVPSRSGLYYRDQYGQMQGPFTMEHMHAWRPYLPMNAPVWMLDESDFFRAAAQASAPPQQGQEQQHLPKEREPPQQDGNEGQPAQGSMDGSSQQQEDGAQGPLALGQEAGTEQEGHLEQEAKGERSEGQEEGSRVAQGDRERTAASGDAGDASGQVGGGDAEEGAGGDDGGTGPAPSNKRQRTTEQPGAGPDPPDAQAGGRWCSAEEAVRSVPSVELAEVLGDGVLLTDWRAQQGQGLAPPAPIWEHWLLYGARSQQAQPQSQAAVQSRPRIGEEVDEDEGGGDSRLAYAEAVLAGLPADDEAVIISQLALSAGKQLQDVIDFSYLAGASRAAPTGPSSQVDYTCAMRDPHSGRLKAAGLAEAGLSDATMLYGEMSSWCNPDELERSLQEAAKRRGQQLPPHIWKKLKERKLIMKKKMRAL